MRHLRHFLSITLAVFISLAGVIPVSASNQPNHGNEAPLNSVPMSQVFYSQADFDGWIRERGENFGEGGLSDKLASTLNVGDDSQNRQYRSILSFNTESLPDNAVITSARIILKLQSHAGTFPNASTHGSLVFDLKDSTFNNSLAFELADFSALSSPGTTIDAIYSLVDNWYGTNFSSTNLSYISKVGYTQLRLRYTIDDDNDFIGDYLKFYSGNSSFSPQLIVNYALDIPAAPVLVSPADVGILPPGPVTFSWQPVSGATGYYLEYTGTSSGNTGSLSASTTSTTITLAEGTYSWKVKARNSIGEGPWSATRALTLTTCSLGAPTLISPTDGASLPSGTVSFSWGAVSGATEYKFDYSGSSSGTSGWISGTSYSLSLAAGTYTWTAQARSASCTGPSSSSRTLQIGTVPAAPTLISPADGVTLPPGSVTFSWNSVSGATEYNLYYTGTNSGSSGWISGTSFSVSLATGSYSWYVKARNASGESPSSSSRTLQIGTAPAAPTLISPADGATLPPGSVTFSWNSVSGATEYYFEYSGTSSGTSGWISGTSFSVSLTSGTYTWRVKARNAYGEGPWIGPRTLNIGNVPSAPTLISPADGATLPAGSVTFSWNSVSGATQYYLEYSGPSSGNSGWNSGTSFSVSLTSGTYTWRVKARNATGEGAWSSTRTLYVGNVPSAPTLISPADGATLPPGSVTFSWNSVSGATEYYFEYSGTSSGNSGWTSGTSFSVSLTSGTYNWKVKAKNATGEGAWSSSRALNLTTDPCPAAPTLTSPANSVSLPIGTVLFSWSSVTGATGYYLELKRPYGTIQVPIAANSASYTFASPNTYTWRVKAYNTSCPTGGSWSTARNLTITP